MQLLTFPVRPSHQPVARSINVHVHTLTPLLQPINLSFPSVCHVMVGGDIRLCAHPNTCTSFTYTRPCRALSLPPQKKAAARLHRFYVPQPLVPSPPPPSLKELFRPPSFPRSRPSPLKSSPAAASSHPLPPAVLAAASLLFHPSSPTAVVLEGEEARHAARALRLQPGDRVELCDGRGNLLEGLVTCSDKQRVWVSWPGDQ